MKYIKEIAEKYPETTNLKFQMEHFDNNDYIIDNKIKELHDDIFTKIMDNCNSCSNIASIDECRTCLICKDNKLIQSNYKSVKHAKCLNIVAKLINEIGDKYNIKNKITYEYGPYFYLMSLDDKFHVDLYFGDYVFQINTYKENHVSTWTNFYELDYEFIRDNIVEFLDKWEFKSERNKGTKNKI